MTNRSYKYQDTGRIPQESYSSFPIVGLRIVDSLLYSLPTVGGSIVLHNMGFPLSSPRDPQWHLLITGSYVQFCLCCVRLIRALCLVFASIERWTEEAGEAHSLRMDNICM